MMAKSWAESCTFQIEKHLTQLLNLNTTAPNLLKAMSYASLNGGKRIRPLLVIASGAIGNAQENTLLHIASALELIHCYSLVHDDLPAMDNDDLRRGLPTCHKKFDEATAILAGDALQTLAFEILSHNNLCLPPQTQLQITNLIAKASGINGMAGGQAIDLASTGTKPSFDELQIMHQMKTGALIKVAILAGYLCGTNFNQLTYTKLEQIGTNLGLLFQIIDDILDTTQDTQTLGKTANKDATQNKATYVSVYGLNQAKQLAQDLYNVTCDELIALPNSHNLQYLCNTIYTRAN